MSQFLNKKYLTLLPQYIACYLTAYYVERNPFQRVLSFEVFYEIRKARLFLRVVVNIPIQTLIIPP